MQLQDLVVDDPRRGEFRVHRSTMTSEEVLVVERERIFGRSWLYVGHESEVPKNGDFRRRQVAARPLILVRGSDGAVRVLNNSCRHRGALVCRTDAGTASAFTCFYHGWAYSNKGDLVAVPEAEGYPASFDQSLLGLMPPPQSAAYRGFWFVNFDAQAVDLITALGDARAFIDLVVDQSEHGIRVLPAAVRYGINANWKLMAENTVDSYHVPILHHSYLQHMTQAGVSVSQQKGRDWGLDLGRGHGAFSGQERSAGAYGSRATRLGDAAKTQMALIRARQVARYGAGRGDWGEDWAMGRINFLVYPNLGFIGKTTVRTIWPVNAGQTEIMAWTIVPAEESGAELEERVHDIPLFQGPGGFASPDDTEAMEACQAGYAAREVEWTDLSKGMHRTPTNGDEVQMRGFWRQWLAHVLGLAVSRHADDAIDVAEGA